MPKQWAIFHDWHDLYRAEASPASQTGEFFYIGTATECAQEMTRITELHPEWRLSVHRLVLEIASEQGDRCEV